MERSFMTQMRLFWRKASQLWTFLSIQNPSKYAIVTKPQAKVFPIAKVDHWIIAVALTDQAVG